MNFCVIDAHHCQWLLLFFAATSWLLPGLLPYLLQPIPAATFIATGCLVPPVDCCY